MMGIQVSKPPPKKTSKKPAYPDPSISLRNVILSQRNRHRPDMGAVAFYLDKGADPLAPSPDGISIFEELCSLSSNQSFSGACRTQMLLALMDRGANPLLYPDKFIKMYDFSPGIGDAMLSVIKCKESLGVHLRDSQNRTPLHLLMHCRLNDMGIRKKMKEKNSRVIDPSWVIAADASGETPLHALWSRSDLPSGWAPCVWEITHSLWEKGADLLAADHKGSTVLSLIKAHTDAGFPCPENMESRALYTMMLSEAQAAEIRQGTKMAPLISARPTRL